MPGVSKGPSTKKYIVWSVLVLISLSTVIAGLNALGAYQTPHRASPTATTASRATSASRPRVRPTPPPLPPLNLPWPAGWDVTLDDGSQRPYAVQDTASLEKRGKLLVVINASIGRVDASESLKDFLETLLDGETFGAEKSGSSIKASALEEGTWRGRPSLEYEITYRLGRQTFRQRRVVTRGSGDLTCMVVLKADDAKFERYLPTFERLRDQFPCP